MKSDIFNIILSRIMIEKKKAVVALCLILVMVFMVIKAFVGKTPAGAEAVVTPPQAAAAQSNSHMQISFVDLPYVKGRNDVLNRDFFTVEGLKSSDKSNTDVNPNGDEAHIRRLIGNLKLEAIARGKTPHASINGKIYTIGNKLILEDNGDIYKFEIIEIEEKSVLIKYRQTQVELEFTDQVDWAH